MKQSSEEYLGEEQIEYNNRTVSAERIRALCCEYNSSCCAG